MQKFSEEEEKMCMKFMVERVGRKISTEDLEILCMELNDKFHSGAPVRKARSVGSRIYVMRKDLAGGYPDGRRRKKSPPSAPVIVSDPGGPPPPQKKYSSESLNRMVACAKEVKRKADAFCLAVNQFAEEFERDRELLKKTARLRQAAEEVSRFI